MNSKPKQQVTVNAKQAKDVASTSAIRKPYAGPEIKKLGDVTSLTKGGAGPVTDTLGLGSQ